METDDEVQHPTDSTFSHSGSRRSISRVILDNVAPKPVPVQEMLHLSPFEKFVKYRIFPWKVFLNLLILSLLLAYIFAYQVKDNQFQANSRFGLASMFFSVNDKSDASLHKKLSTIEDFTGYLRHAVDAYYEVPRVSTGIYMHYVTSPQQPQPLQPELKLTYNHFDGTKFVKVTPSFLISEENPIGPFSNVSRLIGAHEVCYPKVDSSGNAYIPCRNESIGEFFDRLVSAELSCQLRGVRINPGDSVASITKWSVKINFVFSAHNAMIDAKASFVPSQTQHTDTLPSTLVMIIIPLCLWDIVLRLRFFQRYRIYMTNYLPSWISMAQTYGPEYFQELERREMRRADRGWTVFAITSDFMTIIFASLSLAEAVARHTNPDLRVWRTLALGLASMFSCTTLISYLQTSPKFYVLMKSLSTALPHLAMYFIGVLPIFMGFALCGMVVFGGFTNTFETLPNAMVTLFCNMNGDSILMIFTLIDQSGNTILRIFSRLFLTVFLFLFICNVLNIALSIVQDSYTHVKDVYEVCQFDQDKANEKIDGNSEQTTKDRSDAPQPLHKAVGRRDLAKMLAAIQGSSQQ